MMINEIKIHIAILMNEIRNHNTLLMKEIKEKKHVINYYYFTQFIKVSFFFHCSWDGRASIRLLK